MIKLLTDARMNKTAAAAEAVAGKAAAEEDEPRETRGVFSIHC